MSLHCVYISEVQWKLFMLNFFTSDILEIASWLFLCIQLIHYKKLKNFSNPFLLLILKLLNEWYAYEAFRCCRSVGIKLLFTILKIYASSEIIVACMITLYAMLPATIRGVSFNNKNEFYFFHDNLHFVCLHELTNCYWWTFSFPFILIAEFLPLFIYLSYGRHIYRGLSSLWLFSICLHSLGDIESRISWTYLTFYLTFSQIAPHDG